MFRMPASPVTIQSAKALGFLPTDGRLAAHPAIKALKTLLCAKQPDDEVNMLEVYQCLFKHKYDKAEGSEALFKVLFVRTAYGSAYDDWDRMRPLYLSTFKPEIIADMRYLYDHGMFVDSDEVNLSQLASFDVAYPSNLAYLIKKLEQHHLNKPPVRGAVLGLQIFTDSDDLLSSLILLKQNKRLEDKLVEILKHSKNKHHDYKMLQFMHDNGLLTPDVVLAAIQSSHAVEVTQAMLLEARERGVDKQYLQIALACQPDCLQVVQQILELLLDRSISITDQITQALAAKKPVRIFEMMLSELENRYDRLTPALVQEFVVDYDYAGYAPGLFGGREVGSSGAGYRLTPH